MNKVTDKSALILGATGLIGKLLLRQLLNAPEFSRVVAPTRRKLELAHSKLINPVGELTELASVFEAHGSVDVVFCCLGTTIKKAGSKEAFELVDLVYPFEAAKLAKRAGVPHYALVSAMGADEKSLFFYNRVKGKLEHRLKDLAFPFLTVVRPSLLLGDRGSESRFGEEVGAVGLKMISPLMKGRLEHLKPVEGEKVAARLFSCAVSVFRNEKPEGVQVVLSGNI